MMHQTLICNDFTLQIHDELKRFMGKTVKVHDTVGIVKDIVVDFTTPSFGDWCGCSHTITSVQVIISTGKGDIIKYINSISDLKPVPMNSKEDNTMKQTVVFDFDGVIHSYTSGWQGATVIPDPPVPGIKEAIAEIRSAGYEVVVVSTRCATATGYGAIRAWLIDHGIVVDDVKTEKPPAIVYIDDRAICFDGKPEQLLSKIQTFKPWNK